MKRLFLLRHAKTGFGLSDQTRPLAERGKQEAFWLGQYLNKADLLPEYILCSSAVRAQESLSQLLSGAETDITQSIRDDLYLASGQNMAGLVRTLTSAINSAMIIGHNPGLSLLFQDLVADSANAGTGVNYPTCAVGILDFDINDWSDLKSKSGQVVEFIIPSEKIG